MVFGTAMILAIAVKTSISPSTTEQTSKLSLCECIVSHYVHVSCPHEKYASVEWTRGGDLEVVT